LRVEVTPPGTGEPFHVGLERHGPEDAPPVVLVHGLADDRSLWRHVAPRLAERNDVVTVDMPGHGESDAVPDGAGIDWFADVVSALIDRLELVEPVLGGLSMGGGVAQYVAGRSPGRLRGLALVSTSPVFPDTTRKRFLDRAAVAEREGMAAVVDATVSRWFTPGFIEQRPDEIEATRATVLRTDPISFARASRANAARDATPLLASIDVPVLFIAGLDDPADPRRAEAIYRERVRDLRVRLVPGASHLLPVEAPEIFLAEVESYLDALPARTSRVPA
jgi:pimeloyl-ACP methyl ester carboxylesterase